MLKQALGILALTLTASVGAAVRLPAVFSDHAVLARKAAVPIFGSADPGEAVRVTFRDQTRTATADAAGFWLVELDLAAAPADPAELRVNDLVVRDVVVGGLFLASGQSNMALRLRRTPDFAAAVRRPRDHRIRCFEVARRPAFHPQSPAHLRGRWVIAAPDAVGDFSALAYHFASAVSSAARTPVGIIHASASGTPIESWLDAAALRAHAFPSTLRLNRERLQLHRKHPEAFAAFHSALSAWEKKFRRACPPPRPVPPNASWARLDSREFPGDGVVRLRTRVKISAAAAKRGFSIDLEGFRFPSVFQLDGKTVLDNRLPALRQEYCVSGRVPGGKFSSGIHELTIRIHASRHGRLRLPARLRLAGQEIASGWSIRRECDFGPLSAAAQKALPNSPGARLRAENLASTLYNGMIHPLAPCALTGIIWYQGESNVERAREYGRLFPALITSWRKLFRDPELPFYFCLLAPFREKSADPAFEGDFARFRHAQMLALQLPRTAMAVLFDTGESCDIRPADKRTPADRLAALVLHEIYRLDRPCYSPVATHAECRNGVVTVHFAHTYGGLVAAPLPAAGRLDRRKNLSARFHRNSPDTEVEGFALAAADGSWHWADRAVISGDTVAVSSARVPHPVKIRYGWGDNPTANLVNRASLPAAPLLLFTREKK